MPAIQYQDLEVGSHLALYRALAKGATRFIIGPDVETIVRYVGERAAHLMPPELEDLGLISGPLAVVHEFTWQRLVGLLEKSPFDAASWSFYLDWRAIAAGWAPPVYFPTSLPEFPSSLSRIRDWIDVELFDVPGFTRRRRKPHQR